MNVRLATASLQRYDSTYYAVEKRIDVQTTKVGHVILFFCHERTNFIPC